MRDMFPGWNLPSPAERDALWDQGVVALDSNVLLNLYRYSPETRSALQTALGEFESRLWIPHRVAFEFHRKRMDVLLEQRIAREALRARLDETRAKLKTEISNKLKELGRRDVDPFLAEVESSFDKLSSEFEKLETDYHRGLGDQGDNGDDPIYSEIEKLVSERVGDPFEPTEEETILIEAARRFDEKIPPGYRDQGKEGNDRFGDVLVWFQLIAHAKETRSPILLITDDQKDDWIWEVKGKKLGPRPELVAEMREETGQLFHIYSSAQFVSIHRNKVGKPLDKENLAELEDTSSKTENVSELAFQQWLRHDQQGSWPHAAENEGRDTSSAPAQWARTADPESPSRQPVARSMVGSNGVHLALEDRTRGTSAAPVKCRVVMPRGQPVEALVGNSGGGFFETWFPEFFGVPPTELVFGTYVVFWTGFDSTDVITVDTFEMENFRG